jgi:hypothetical protein
VGARFGGRTDSRQIVFFVLACVVCQHVCVVCGVSRLCVWTGDEQECEASNSVTNISCLPKRFKEVVSR